LSAVYTKCGARHILAVMTDGKLNSRQEKFCQGLAAGASQRQAYLDAGYLGRAKTADQAGSRLSTNVKVQRRLAELQVQNAKELAVTVASLDAVMGRRFGECGQIGGCPSE
jgi:phage terminase small subunit